MARFSCAQSTASAWEHAVTECLTQLGTGIQGQTLGFVYATDVHAAHLPAITAALRSRTGIESWIGTLGSGICCGDREYYDTPALALLLADFAADSFRLFYGVNENLHAFHAAYDAWYRQHPAHFGIVHADPRNSHTVALVEQLAATLPGGFLVGGLTSSESQYWQVAGKPIEGGLSGIIFDAGAVTVATGLTQGCTPIGTRHRITDCENNIAIRIDERPALDVFYEDIGAELADDIQRAAGYIFAGFPVTGSDSDDYLVRNLIGVDSANKLLGIGEILTPGMPIIFCKRDKESAEHDLRRMLKALKRRTSTPPSAGVYYSCLGRGRHLFGDDSEELKIIREQLGDFPLVGFFANGEISHNRVYGYTGVLSLFL